jgi:hypothetical protein
MNTDDIYCVRRWDMAETVKKEKEVRAKLFLNGRSQAVRLPKEFRLGGG